jgi:hypothetical protein
MIVVCQIQTRLTNSAIGGTLRATKKSADISRRLKILQAYVDEAGRLIALEEFEPNRETWTFAQVLPSIPEHYRCCCCAHPFVAHPGAMVQCPQCGHLYAQVE